MMIFKVAKEAAKFLSKESSKEMVIKELEKEIKKEQNKLWFFRKETKISKCMAAKEIIKEAKTAKEFKLASKMLHKQGGMGKIAQKIEKLAKLAKEVDD